MAKKIKSVPLKINRSTCESTSSNCITWQGPDIPCLSLCKGATITEVVYQLGINFCKLYETLDPDNYNTECLELTDNCTITFKDIFQALIDKVCALQIESQGCNLRAEIVRNEGPYTVKVSNGVAPYTYEWSIADTLSLFSITGATDEPEVSVTITDVESVSFDACNSTNAGRIGLLKVFVTDVNGCVSSDTYMLLNVTCS